MAGVSKRFTPKEFSKWLTFQAQEFQKGMQSDKILSKILVEAGNDIKKDIQRSMKGTKRASWSYKRGTKRHFPSAPFNPPAVDTGELWGRILFDTRTNSTGCELEIGTDVLHGLFMEIPRRGKLPFDERPWLVPAVNRNFNSIMRRIRKETKINFAAKFKRMGF